MALIPQAFIDDLLTRIDIVAVVESRVPLKKAGREHQACCPFHDENTPSFTVSPAKQFYHCFGCGAHGTAITFLMEYERLPFPEAVEVLAAQAGMEIPREARAGGEGDSQKPLFEALDMTDRAFQRQLRDAPEAIAYLKNRGISGETAKAFGIGFAPPGWDFLRSRLPNRRAGIDAGLLIARDDGHSYDRFRNRIVFPIRDNRGRTIAFGGRTLEDASASSGQPPAKYLNSPETPLFHKGRSLYGLFEARQSLKTMPRVLVVEGYMDVVALAQHGFANAVATLGTATTTEHLQALFRVTDEVVFCFDGDAAGRRAAWRALDNALPAMRGTRRVRFLFLPRGEDPDSLVRGDNGTERLRELADASQPASRVLLDGLTEDLEMSTPDGRSRLVEKARPFVRKLPPEAFKRELIQEIAANARLPPDDLERLYQTGTPASRPAQTQTGQRDMRRTSVRRALQLLMNDPALADNVTIDFDRRRQRTTGAALLVEAIEFFRTNPNSHSAALLERLRDRRGFDTVARLAARTPRGNPEDLAQEFTECVAHVMSSDGDSGDRTRYETLLNKQEHQPLTDTEAAELQSLLKNLRAHGRRP